jgi:hypothetical protein
MSIPMSAPSGRSVTVAALQFHCVADAAVNVDRAEALVREAAAKGANLILLQVSASARLRDDQLTMRVWVCASGESAPLQAAIDVACEDNGCIATRVATDNRVTYRFTDAAESNWQQSHVACHYELVMSRDACVLHGQLGNMQRARGWPRPRECN